MMMVMMMMNTVKFKIVLSRFCGRGPINNACVDDIDVDHVDDMLVMKIATKNRPGQKGST